ncbi:hypothetical protein [Ruminococcus sp.]|uniref:hypothetical protein n=1 Tax=Ruminococcus sp. TaxID=41978 RepID=UPI0025EC3E65|nr:hypothetical protein [Ruminococcus sp.]MBR1431578.1 hypothetical protein [Ruminococcus sp.]
MDYDIIIIILIILISIFFLVKRIINDYKKAQIKKKRFYKEKGFFSTIYEIRMVYGCLISLIIGGVIYIYFRLSGQLENIFPDMLGYYG